MKRVLPLNVALADVSHGGALLDFVVLREQDLTPELTAVEIMTVAQFTVSQN